MEGDTSFMHAWRIRSVTLGIDPCPKCTQLTGKPHAYCTGQWYSYIQGCRNTVCFSLFSCAEGGIAQLAGLAGMSPGRPDEEHTQHWAQLCGHHLCIVSWVLKAELFWKKKKKDRKMSAAIQWCALGPVCFVIPTPHSKEGKHTTYAHPFPFCLHKSTVISQRNINPTQKMPDSSLSFL